MQGERRKQAESLLRSEDKDEDGVDEEYEESTKRFEKIMEEDRKREEG